MADRSGIEWTDATWNPIRARNKKTGRVGWHCEHATTGCEFCYAEDFNKRLGTGLPFKPGHRKDVELFLDEEMLTRPLRWKRPRMIFPNSMTDLFAEFVPDEWIDKIFAVMALTPHHTYQPLTKRAQRMRDYFASRSVRDEHGFEAEDIRVAVTTLAATPSRREMAPALKMIPLGQYCRQIAWPLPNVWLGVSAERQQEWDERVELLGATPAAIRFVSIEPMLSAIDCGNAFDPPPETSPYKPIDWIICGGESGAEARPMHPDWARSLRDQCDAAEVPFFFKQWGEWTPGENVERRRGTVETATWFGDSWSFDKENLASEGGHYEDQPDLYRVGKSAAGRHLDGELHNQFPTRGGNHGV